MLLVASAVCVGSCRARDEWWGCGRFGEVCGGGVGVCIG